MGPRRLPSARLPGLVATGRCALAHGKLARARLAPFRVAPRVRSSSGKRSPLHAPPPRLARPRDRTRFDGEDASHRRLQPTLDTCTRRTARFPCSAARAADDRGPRRPDRPRPERRAAHDARPPLDDPAPGEPVLDGTRSASTHSPASPLGPGRVTGRRPRARGVFVHRRDRSREPLTPPVTPPRLRLSPARSRSRDRVRHPRVNASGLPGRGAFPRRVPRSLLAQGRCPPPSPTRDTPARLPTSLHRPALAGPARPTSDTPGALPGAAVDRRRSSTSAILMRSASTTS